MLTILAYLMGAAFYLEWFWLPHWVEIEPVSRMFSVAFGVVAVWMDLNIISYIRKYH